MKALKCFLVLFSFVGLMLVGCSDQSQSPVSPTDQSIQGSTSFQKNVVRKFLGEERPNPVNPGLIVYPTHTANGITFGSIQENTLFIATFLDGGPDSLSGNGVLHLNYKFNNNTFEGFTWGKLTVTPWNPAAGGVWEISWHGKMWVDQTTGMTISPLKWVGHGSGGAINGMQLYGDDTIYMTTFLDWIGKDGQNCYIKEH